MLVPIADASAPLTVALSAAAGLAAMLTLLGKYIAWVINRREDSFAKVRADAAIVEVDRQKLRQQDERDVREESNRLITERKEMAVQLKADNAAMRGEFMSEIAALKKSIRDEGEERALVKLSAEAAHMRADEAMQQLAAARRERGVIEAKLREVDKRANAAEQHTVLLEKEKNIEIEGLRALLAQSNRKIEELENYIREHKMTVSLQRGTDTITASIEPPPPRKRRSATAAAETFAAPPETLATPEPTEETHL